MPLPAVLTPDEIADALKRLRGWQTRENELFKRLQFENFDGAMKFMQACVPGIEQLNHHPVWSNKFNTVELHLTTFDVGNRVTTSDVKLAEILENVLSDYGEDFGFVPE
jgi:4a-hydroxytetrahydrobiopterin dehydratase